MSYIVNRTDGNIAAVVNDGVLDTTTSLNLVGKGYANYAETIAESLVALLENFAGPLPPRSPLPGQLWYNKLTSQIEVYNETKFTTINNVTVSASSPSNPANGDFWQNSTKRQLFFYRDNAWQLIAPAYSVDQGRTESVVETFYDHAGTGYTVFVLYCQGARTAVISNHPSFDTFPYVTGFPTIKPGINLSDNSGVSSSIFNGPAASASIAYGLDPVSDATYMHSNANTSTTGTITISSDGGLTLGSSGDLVISTDINNITQRAITNKKFTLGGFGGGSLTLDNSTNWIGINKNSPGFDLDVGGTINADEYISSSAGYKFSDDQQSKITSVGGTIKISTQGINSVVDSIIASGNDVTVPTLFANTLQVNTNLLSRATDNYFLGNVEVAKLPTVSYHVANKEYVDQTVLSVLLPPGSIIMWYGDVNLIPQEWAICDGSNGTPDLRDRFVMGAGLSATMGQTGSNNFVSTTTNSAGVHRHSGIADAGGDHNHTGLTAGHALTADEIANHQHNFTNVYAVRDDANPPLYDRNGNRVYKYDQWNDDGDNDSGDPASFPSVTDFAGNSQPHVHGISNSSTHTHNITLDPEGLHEHIVSFDNRPSFFALYYIIRVSV